VSDQSLRGRVGAWLEDRTGYTSILHEMLNEPVPGGARWAYVFGSALTITFVIQAVTGVLLMTAYAPSSSTAWASVYHISFVMSGGWLVRGLHHFGSQAMVVLLALHVLQVAIYGAYKRPRELNWLFGLGLLAVTLGFALTGYLLPWDQKGYWATQVATNIAGTSPGIGPQLQTVMQGGTEYGSLTLTHFHALHVMVLPASLLGLVMVHLFLFRKHGVTPPTNADLKKVDKFFPAQVWKDLAAGLAVLGVLFALAIREHGAPLDAPADPASDYPARPEWYFLPLFQLLKYFHGPLEMVGTMGIPAIAGLYLVLLPFFDKKPTTALGPRLPLLAPLFFGIVGMGGLMFAAMSSDAADTKFQASRKVADERAKIALDLASKGIPPGGALEMVKHDPELRGRDIFEKKCAACHVLGDIGDRAKAKAPSLDGWGTEAWILQMMHDPDAKERFGSTPFAGMMPSMDVAPKDPKDAESFKPMKPEDMKAAAVFLAAQGDEPGEASPARDTAQVEAGEKIVKSRCTACHTYKGEGDDSSIEIAPDLARYGSIAWVESQVKNPATKATYREKALSAEYKGHMPRFDEELSAEDAALVARWARSHARSSSPVAAK